MSNEILTINGLAGMIKRSFDRVDQRFNKIDQRFDKMEKNQKTIIMKLEDVVYRREFDELEGRVKILEQALSIAR